MRDRKNIVIAAMAAVLVILGLAACSPGSSSKAPVGGSQGAAQVASEQIASAAQIQAAVDEYVAQIHGNTAEIKNVEARDIRLLDPNRTQYVYETTPYGQLAGYWVARGKISSTQSQLTNVNNVYWKSNTNSLASAVTASNSDDGTNGPEECPDGVFFFDENTNAMVTVCPGADSIKYSDAPMHITSQPLMVMDASSKVTSGIPVHGSTK